ncbi:hypothetical protein QSE00_20610 [Arenibacter sp. M-2]|uniref:hypothetical protein n=1 Tax=unclassified Arenibacter TaxID=2615047 RepID=UPI000D768D0B|nr:MULTISPECIES: hypothetical protein [unclassified Arenibacter]MDL5514229.1 hypothetical protein [Arenibacter sp. M-2]PXX22496.1 hypothetical protein C7972_12418 [Arenibacter sp. ARW7G5Y1]|tara:strand:- start:6169 stop:6432 length:264 start_codon:yes stop_codon:yes gene_type:complete
MGSVFKAESMPISILIVLATLAIAFGVMLYFKNKNNALDNAHRDLVGYYQECIENHRVASAARENGLNSYSFITYNLKESLLDQSIV